MATNTAIVTPAPRQDPRQVANTLKRTVTFATVGLSTGVAFQNSIPQEAQILSVVVDIEAAFDGGGVINVGNDAEYDNLVDDGDVNIAAIGATQVLRGIGGAAAKTADVTPYVKVTGTLTTGIAHITILYEGGNVS